VRIAVKVVFPPSWVWTSGKVFGNKSPSLSAADTSSATSAFLAFDFPPFVLAAGLVAAGAATTVVVVVVGAAAAVAEEEDTIAGTGAVFSSAAAADVDASPSAFFLLTSSFLLSLSLTTAFLTTAVAFSTAVFAFFAAGFLGSADERFLGAGAGAGGAGGAASFFAIFRPLRRRTGSLIFLGGENGEVFWGGVFCVFFKKGQAFFLSLFLREKICDAWAVGNTRRILVCFGKCFWEGIG